MLKIITIVTETIHKVFWCNEKLRRWSYIVAVRLPDIIMVEIMLEKIFSITVFDFEVTLVGWIIDGRNIDEV